MGPDWRNPKSVPWQTPRLLAALLLTGFVWLFCDTPNAIYLLILILTRRGQLWRGSSDTAASSPGRPANAPPWFLWAGLLLILAAEAVAFDVRFQARSLGLQPAGWASLELWILQSVRPLIAVLSGALVLASNDLLAEFCRPPVGDLKQRRRSTVSLLILHFAFLAAFSWLTVQVLEAGRAEEKTAPLWTFAWVASAACSLACWALCLLPISAWGRILARGWPVLLAASAARAVFGWLISASLSLWTSLAANTFWCAVPLLRLFYSDVICEPETFVVGTPSFVVTVAHECSGYEGIGLVAIFLSFYLWFDRRALRFPQAFALLPLGVATAFAANVVRLAALVAIGTSWSPETALSGFHSQAGWLCFLAIALGLAAIATNSSFFSVRSAACRSPLVAEPTTAYLAPFLGALATSMVTGAFSAGIDWLYGVRVIVAAGLLAYYWPSYTDFRWSWNWRPLALGAATFAIWLLLAPAGSNSESVTPEQLQIAAGGWALAWIAIRAAGYLATAPLIEELAFRGFLMRRFASVDFDKVPLNKFHVLGFFGSSVLFGLLHGKCWLPATAAGMLFAVAARQRGNLGDAVAAHAAANALLTLYASMTGAWYLCS